MLFTTLLVLFSATSATAAAIETSVLESARSLTDASAEDVSLGKRAGESLHFVNCYGNGYGYSLIVYCHDDSTCGRQPTTDNQCFMPSADFWHWEGRTEQPCTFPTGVTFYYTLPADTFSKPLYTIVGSGHNNHAFNVWKDDQHTFYFDSNGANCKSVYYVLPK